jgi:hypothetical protein
LGWQSGAFCEKSIGFGESSGAEGTRYTVGDWRGRQGCRLIAKTFINLHLFANIRLP